MPAWVDQTKDWFPYVIEITGGADITNNYLAFGLDAGLLAIALFIFLLIRAFRTLGQALAVVRSALPTANETEYFLWGLGCMLSVHISTWFGITYFDQIYVVWFMQLAAISSISQACIEANRKPVKDNDLRKKRIKQSIYRNRVNFDREDLSENARL